MIPISIVCSPTFGRINYARNSDPFKRRWFSPAHITNIMRAVEIETGEPCGTVFDANETQWFTRIDAPMLLKEIRYAIESHATSERQARNVIDLGPRTASDGTEHFKFKCYPPDHEPDMEGVVTRAYPCGWCGADNAYIREWAGGDSYSVACPECRMQSPTQARKWKAMRVWNTFLQRPENAQHGV